MVFLKGEKKEVVNIGLGIQQVFKLESTVFAFIKSLKHMVCLPPLAPIRRLILAYQLTIGERSALAQFHTVYTAHDKDKVLRRTALIIALKKAYFNAIGRPIAWLEIEFNIIEQTCVRDGEPLTGWQFRQHIVLLSETYQCVTANFLGTETEFFWDDNPSRLTEEVMDLDSYFSHF